MDPRYAMDAYASVVGSLVFASLVAPDRDAGYAPYLARSWEMVDETTWRFTLDPRFAFHDGSPLTAADVAATYRALLDPDMGSPRRLVLSRIASIEASGAHEVVFRLSEPDAAFLEAATIGILPESMARELSLEGTRLVGAGPYRIVAVEPDRYIRLEAFESFCLGKPTLPAVEFRIVPDTLMRALELRHGSVDFVQNALDPDTVEWLEANDERLSVYRGQSNNFQYLGMNLEHEALSDVRVRRAIAHAIDRETIVRGLLADQATIATGLLPPHHWAYARGVRRYDHDPERARRLLDRAGLVDPDGPGPAPRLILSYKTTTNELARRTAEAFAEQLAAVGIRLEIRSYEWGTFFADVRNGSFHLYSLQWVGLSDPDIYRQVFHSSMVPPNGNNRGRYRNAKMDKLTERGIGSASPEQRRRIYRRVQRLAARQLPYVPLWWPLRIVVATERLEGFTPHPSGDLFALSRSRLSASRRPHAATVRPTRRAAAAPLHRAPSP